ncbi:chromate efflux transporter [Flavobacteriales bacterium]|nr:chromate efflux transporter [Flavobacteriales bacterium]
MKSNKNILEVAQVFFKLGLIAFGGPAAHVSMMEDEIVTKRKWMDRQHFLDLMGATNLIPGPNSTEMTMHCGYQRAGVIGLFVAGFCFIFPAIVITCILAFLYVEYGTMPQVEQFVFGIKPAVLAIIAVAVLKLGKKALKSWELGVLGAFVIAASLSGINEVLALLGAGLLGASIFYAREKTTGKSYKSLLPFLSLNLTTAVIVKSVIPAMKVFWIFLKVGAVLYGSGYVLFAYLEDELVSAGYLTMAELLDAIAVGQFTPGPVLSTATFIGYQLAGFKGAMAASVGIFLPSFVFVWMLNPLVKKMRSSKFLGYFLDSVNIAAVSIMLAVLFTMGKETIFPTLNEEMLFSWQALVIAALSFFFVFGPKKLNSMWVVIGGGFLGYLLSFV